MLHILTLFGMDLAELRARNGCLTPRPEAGHAKDMTDEMFRAVLETAGAKADKDGWTALPEGRLMTFYAAHAGVPLTIAKIEAVKLSQRVAWARSAKGDTYVVSLDDLFAAAMDQGHEAHAGRKAGFLG